MTELNGINFRMNGVHVFLGGEHRPYCWDQVGVLAGRLRRPARLSNCCRISGSWAKAYFPYAYAYAYAYGWVASLNSHRSEVY